MTADCPICDAEFVCASCHRKLKSENKRLKAINAELLAMLERFARYGEKLWDDENFRDGYKKVNSGDLVDCRKLLAAMANAQPQGE